MIADEVVGMGYNGNFVVETKSGQFECECVILATGSSRKAPPSEAP
jgi:thioredoxin reductase